MKYLFPYLSIEFTMILFHVHIYTWATMTWLGIYSPYATILWISRSNTSTISISSITYRCLILCHLSWHITIHSINTSSLYFPCFYHLDDHIDDMYVLSKLWICILKYFFTYFCVNIIERISQIEIQFLYQTTSEIELHKIKLLSIL